MIKYEYKTDDHGYLIKVPIKKTKAEKQKLEGGKAGVQKAIADVFIADGWEVIRYNSGTFKILLGKFERWFTANINLNSGATKGHPDLVAYKQLRAVRIEVKTEKAGSTVSKDQEKYAQNGLKYGNPIAVLRSKDDAVRFIELYKTIGLKEAVNLFTETK